MVMSNALDSPKSTMTSTPFSSTLRTSSSKSAGTINASTQDSFRNALTLFAVVDRMHFSVRELVEERHFIGRAGRSEYLVGAEADLTG